VFCKELDEDPLRTKVDTVPGIDWEWTEELMELFNCSDFEGLFSSE